MKKRKGTVLYLTFMIMSILFLISATLTTVLLGQFQIVRDIGNSVVALYAADTGIEKSLMNRNDPEDIDVTILNNGASYKVDVRTSVDPSCDSNNYCIVSTGSFKNTKRSIQIKY
jgi:hypothetical protein